MVDIEKNAQQGENIDTYQREQPSLFNMSVKLNISFAQMTKIIDGLENTQIKRHGIRQKLQISRFTNLWKILLELIFVIPQFENFRGNKFSRFYIFGDQKK